MASITGWGRGEWSEGAWGEALPVRVGHEVLGWGEAGFGETAWGGERSTLSPMLGQVGIGRCSREHRGQLSLGLRATGAVGEVEAKGNNSVTGLVSAGTGQVGQVTLVTEQTVPVTGLVGTSAVGEVTVVEGSGINVDVTGVEGTSSRRHSVGHR
jgi:hypothetical protein